MGKVNKTLVRRTDLLLLVDSFFDDTKKSPLSPRRKRLPSDGTFESMKIDLDAINNDDFWK